MEQANIYNLIDFGRPTSVRMTTSGAPTNANYTAYANAAGLFLCPSDANTGRIITENNYRANFGGATPNGGAISTTTNNGSRPFLRESPSSAFSLRGFGEWNQVLEP